jgi:hypothetical protein
MGISVFPAPSSGLSGIDITLPANAVPTITGSVARVTANVSVPAGTYLAYQNGLVGTTWTVNGVSAAAPTGQSAVVSFTTTGSSFIVDYTPSTQLTWGTQTVNTTALWGADVPLLFGGGRYLAFTNNMNQSWTSHIYVSTNFTDWTRSAYVPDGTDTAKILAYNTTATQYKYVMTTNRKFFGSTDGATWTNTFNDSPNPSGMYMSAFSNTAAWKYVLGYGAGSIVASTSGASWSTRNISTSYGNVSAVGGGNDSSLFMYVGTKVNNDYHTSTDSVTWTQRTHPAITDEIRWCGFVNSVYWMSGLDGVFSSTDAITWTLRATNAKAIASIIYKNSAYWAVDNYVTWGSSAKKIWKSTDGTTWTAVAGLDKTVGLIEDASRLISWTGTLGLTQTTEAGFKSKIYSSTTGVGIVPTSGEITLVPITSTAVTAS